MQEKFIQIYGENLSDLGLLVLQFQFTHPHLFLSLCAISGSPWMHSSLMTLIYLNHDNIMDNIAATHQKACLISKFLSKDHNKFTSFFFTCFT